ncbi:MAG: hypothetical protein J6W10_00480 [Kiritimatiellae bacterium]|nr:hypothetical protein [Kiritimatiellia bacterium]
MKYRFFVRWEDCAEFEVEAENETEAFDEIADVVCRYEYEEKGLSPYRDHAIAQIIAIDGQDYEGAKEEIK